LLATKAWGQSPASAPSIASDVFPAVDPALVREAVGVSHRDLARLRELVERPPALARVSIDWGFGDWESCIDAASHTGNKAIAPSRQNLYHVGNLVFFPTGVPSTKIAFAREGARITQLTVADPNVILTARRE
jgi:hypothetical protein